MLSRFKKVRIERDQLKELTEVLIEIIGDSIKGKLARAALVGLFAFAGDLLSSEPVPTQAPPGITITK
jgi:hypothetical protein